MTKDSVSTNPPPHPPAHGPRETGGLAGTFFGGVPEDIAREVRARLDPALRGVLDRFGARFDALPQRDRSAKEVHP